jgi:hypothetical protein
MRNRSTGRVSLVVGLAGILLGGSMARLAAAPPEAAPTAPAGSDYNQRIVAYIFGTVPITREEFGEYLIARYGPEKLDLLVNKKIIEHFSTQKGVTVTAAEVTAAFDDDCKGMQVDKKNFVEKLLKVYGKTEFEWKEDVIRPRLLLQKLCQDQVQITEDDLKQCFESHYGKKVKCKLIMLPKGPGGTRSAQQIYAHARQSAEAFAEEARKQPNASLAASGGDISPIARFMPGNSDLLEKEAFELQPGDTSRLIENGDSYFILRCEAHIPADATKNFEQEKVKLRAEVYERKLTAEIPKMFKAMRDQANPTLFLKSAETADDLKMAVEKNLGKGVPPPAPGGLKQVGGTR